MDAAAKRLESFRQFLAHAYERLQLEFGFVLWDGSTVPAGYPADGFAIAIADEGVIAALMRKPNAETLLNLWCSARIDLRNGTIFDVVARRPKMRSREMRKQVDWRKAVALGLKFLFVPRGGPWPLEHIADDKPSSGTMLENKHNVQHHYDISNEFYGLFLGPDMAYSSAYFTDWSNDLATAQRDKLDMVCRKLRLRQGERLLDIGCGWGSLLFHAARNYGVKAYGVTLSEKQHSYLQQKIAALHLRDHVSVELRDYATVEGEFDKVNQIEMFEHIGYANHPTYYKTVHRVLKPGGLFHHQAITRPAKRDDKAFMKNSAERAALTKYVMPGGQFDYIGMTLTNLERYGFEVHDVEALREHHARTCRLYHDAIWANRERAAKEAGAATMRLWLAYFAGCSIAFERNFAGVFQTLASKRQRGPSGLPPTRADLYR
jgi:cyclopropane-fatty-acyl-phospholipid synthase